MAKFKSYEDFKSEYENYHYIDKVSNRYYPQKILNEKQIQRYYLQYIRKKQKRNKKENITNEESDDFILYKKVLERDKSCRLLAVLSFSELMIWNQYQNGLGVILDGAHVFVKNDYPWMRYDDKNVVALNRFSHNCLDNMKSPIDGKQITAKQRKKWWQRIVGDNWEYLIDRSNKRN